MRRGVTFIEVLLASAMLLTALVALSSGLRMGLRSATHAQAVVQVEGLARQLVDELERSGASALVARSGEFGPAAPDVRYQLEVRDSDLAGLKLIDVTLAWSEAGRPRHLVLHGAIGPGR